jgi:hypothetical protein
MLAFHNLDISKHVEELLTLIFIEIFGMRLLRASEGEDRKFFVLMMVWIEGLDTAGSVDQLNHVNAKVKDFAA